MSEARKCDRCHVFYEIKPMVFNYITIGVRNIIGISGKSYDLCPNCVELLNKWLKNPDNYPLPGEHYKATDSDGSVKPVGTPIKMEDPYDTWKW